MLVSRSQGGPHSEDDLVQAKLKLWSHQPTKLPGTNFKQDVAACLDVGRSDVRIHVAQGDVLQAFLDELRLSKSLLQFRDEMPHGHTVLDLVSIPLFFGTSCLSFPKTS